MKIKTKLTLGVGLLFILIVLLGILGVKQVNTISNDSKNILVDNYATLDYSRNMLKTLDNIHNENSLEIFETYLQKQNNNITEVGEPELTKTLTEHFEKLKINSHDTIAIKNIRNDLNEIMNLNMNAIKRKSMTAEQTAKEATLWIVGTAILCFIIAFLLLIKLPGNIANPIKELTSSIKLIAAKDYSQRVRFEKHNEFGELAKAFNTMAEKLEEYNNSNLAKLMLEKKRVETLINNMHDPVIGLNEDKKIVFANEEALNILGVTGEDIIGKFAQEVAITNDLVRSLIYELMANEKPEVKNGKIKPMKIFADDKESYFEKEIVDISVTPTGELQKKLVGHVIILRNVTPYKELDFAKTNFIATVSHELKTPIAAIKMSIKLLEDNKIGTVNTEQQNLLESIEDDANRLLKITGELLNMTQVESGNIQLGIIPVDPQEIINYAVNANKVSAEQKNITIETSLPTTITKVMADSEKTAWVITNLISNAIRYSYENSKIFITVETTSNNKIIFSVKDTGQGIAPQYKEKIFDRYFRIPGTKKEGTGLGLSISKEFIEAQGGQITLESDFGAGSTFSVIMNRAS